MEKTRVLITGITGFVGAHLAEFVLDNYGDAYEVHGTRRVRSLVGAVSGRVQLHDCDLTDSGAVLRLLEEVRPDRIFHLAAQADVHYSFKMPEQTLLANILMELNLLEAMRQLKSGARIQIAGSSEEYGMVYQDEVPIKETNQLRPLSPYGVSKVAQDLLAQQYHKSYGLHTVVTRAFNHTGPGRGENFAESSFAKQLADYGRIMRHGNLRAVRDYTDVRDMVRAYWLAIETCPPGEAYNICSGDGHTMRDVIDVLCEACGVNFVEALDPLLVRPSDVPILIGESARFRQLTGWAPLFSFRDTMTDLLNYWRSKSK